MDNEITVKWYGLTNYMIVRGLLNWSDSFGLKLMTMKFIDYDLNWLNCILVYDGEIMFQKVQECDLKGIKWWEINDYKSLSTCVSCLLGKMTKSPFTGKGERANEVFELIHNDVCGPMNISARDGYVYFITFTYDLSRYG